jgi:osmoprotectant transport system substrate-binding protein
VALAIGVLTAGCGGSSSNVTLKVAIGGSPEEAVIGQIYAQALKAAGYNVRVEPKDASSTTELTAGRLSGYPEHVGAVLTNIVGVFPDEVPADPTKAYEKANAALAKERLTVFPPAPFPFFQAVGLLRKAARERGLKTDSDLKGPSQTMTLMGPLGCHPSTTCLGGLETYYGVIFGSFSEAQPAQRYEVLETHRTDASMLPTTDGRLAAEKSKFTILEDDKHLLPAGNVVWLTTQRVVEEAGSGYEEAIVDAQRGLTLGTMQKLDAEVEFEKQPAAKVAAAYLAEKGQR